MIPQAKIDLFARQVSEALGKGHAIKFVEASRTENQEMLITAEDEGKSVLCAVVIDDRGGSLEEVAEYFAYAAAVAGAFAKLSGCPPPSRLGRSCEK